MKMKKIKFLLVHIYVIAIFSMVFTACSNSDSGSQTARIMVRMTDAPGDYDAVNIDVQDVLMKSSTETDDSKGWVSVGTVSPKIYNLLDLTAGVNVLLADNLIPSGYLGQIRLLLGDKNTVVKDGITYNLSTPSAQQSGLKLKINQTLLAGATYDFLLDFDVDQSIVKAGNSGIYNLHPVIKVSTAATSGVIKGSIVPVLKGYQVEVSVPVGLEKISTYANDLGEFQLNGVPAGTYNLTLTPEISSGKVPLVINDVKVVNGAITNVGSVSFK
jgi:Domain of unknown function (DUF4382)